MVVLQLPCFYSVFSFHNLLMFCEVGEMFRVPIVLPNGLTCAAYLNFLQRRHSFEPKPINVVPGQ